MNPVEEGRALLGAYAPPNELPKDAKEFWRLVDSVILQSYRTGLYEAADYMERRINPRHPDCAPCALAGTIADDLRIRARDTQQIPGGPPQSHHCDNCDGIDPQSCMFTSTPKYPTSEYIRERAGDLLWTRNVEWGETGSDDPPEWIITMVAQVAEQVTGDMTLRMDETQKELEEAEERIEALLKGRE